MMGASPIDPDAAPSRIGYLVDAMAGACQIDPDATIVQTDEPRPQLRANARACAYVVTNSDGPCYQALSMRLSRDTGRDSPLFSGVIRETVARDRRRDCLMRPVETGARHH